MKAGSVGIVFLSLAGCLVWLGQESADRRGDRAAGQESRKPVLTKRMMPGTGGMSRGAGHAPASAGIAADEMHSIVRPARSRWGLEHPGSQEHPPGPGMDLRGRQAAPLVAITLADDFRLPASLMHEAGLSRGQNLTAKSQQANRRLIDGFYSDLAAAAGRQTENSGSVSESDAPAGVQGDPASVRDVVVHPGGFGERIRREHDERFRALFGDGAYHSRLLEAAIERSLPALPVSPGAE